MKRAAIFLVILASGLHAQEATTITIRKGDTISVALKNLDGNEGAATTKVLHNDLDLAGWFSLTPPERATYSSDGGS